MAAAGEGQSSCVSFMDAARLLSTFRHGSLDRRKSVPTIEFIAFPINTCFADNAPRGYFCICPQHRRSFFFSDPVQPSHSRAPLIEEVWPVTRHGALPFLRGIAQCYLYPPAQPKRPP